MIISLIAALGNNRELGLDNQMLWHIREDFKHFKETTMGHTLLMGRKTFDSIGRPLPGRETYILTRNTNLSIEKCEIVHSLNEAVEKAKAAGEEELFIAGGAEVYKLGLEHLSVDKLYLSFVDFEGEADAFFPEIDFSGWRVSSEKNFDKTEKSPAWTLKIFERS